MKLWIGAAAGIALVLASGAALAIDAGAVITARQAYLKDVGKNNKAIVDALKLDAPPVASIQASAAAIDAAAPKLMGHFAPGTGMDSGLKTDAKPDIWREAAKFKGDATDFATAAHKLNLVAKTGDVAAIKVASRDLGGSCKACHDSFRKPKD